MYDQKCARWCRSSRDNFAADDLYVSNIQPYGMVHTPYKGREPQEESLFEILLYYIFQLPKILFILNLARHSLYRPQRLHPADYGALGLYFFLMAVMTFYVSHKNNESLLIMVEAQIHLLFTIIDSRNLKKRQL